MSPEPLIALRGLTKTYESSGGRKLVAVRNVSLDIFRGETLGLVGESGCGKSTLSRSLLRLTDPTSGSVWFDGVDITRLPQRRLRPLRRRMQLVFQDTVSSLNPRLSVRQTLREPMLVHGLTGRREADARVIALLDKVGLPPQILSRYPHELSGGQRQRLVIARALSVEPEVIIADEPVSSVDTAMREQILALLVDLQQRFGLTYVFITHDLRLVERIAHRVAVMYLGEIVELAPRDLIFARPAHPYTQALLRTVTSLERGALVPLQGEAPSPLSPPHGCHFHPRCDLAQEQCRTTAPALRVLGPDHNCACHLASPHDSAL